MTRKQQHIVQLGDFKPLADDIPALLDMVDAGDVILTPPQVCVRACVVIYNLLTTHRIMMIVIQLSMHVSTKVALLATIVLQTTSTKAKIKAGQQNGYASIQFHSHL